MIRAIIYDVDGTMVDSEPLHVAAWDNALQVYNYRLSDLSETLQANMAGKKPIVIAKEMVEYLILDITPEELLEKKTDLFMKLIKSDLQGMPGIVETVKRQKKKGYKLGIGTSLTKEYVTLVLSRLELTGCFDVIVTGDEIKNGKPHPDTFLTVANKLQKRPEECLVLEDATSGIKSAKAAGSFCIAIINSNAVAQDTSLADKLISSHDEVTDALIESY